MKALSSNRNGHSSMGRYFWVSVFCWTVAIAGLSIWGVFQNRADMRVLALQVAQGHFEKERAFRLWAASHGGIYVPVDLRNHPNPILEHVLERDVQTPSGRLLTLMPGFQIVRQVRDEFPNLYGVKGGTISLRPFRPENAPDAWQKLALERFETGETEVTEFTEISGEPYLRLMKPHPAERNCLKCHGKAGSKEGDVLGGVEVSLPLKPFLQQESTHAQTSAITHGVVYVLGLLGLFIARRKLEQTEDERDVVQKSLEESDELYRELVENSSDIVFRIDTKGLFTFVNRSACRIAGYSEEELIGQRYTDLILPEYRKEAEKFYVRQFVKKAPSTYYEFPFRTKNGEVVWVGQNVEPITKDEEIAGFQAIARDITERKRLDQILQVRLRLMEMVNSCSLEGLLRMTLDEAEALTGSAIGFYHHVDSEERSVTLCAWSTNTIENMCNSVGTGSHFLIDEVGMWVDCIRERRTVIYNDYDSLPHRKGTPEGHPQIVRFLVTPVFRADKIVAILGLGNKQVDYDGQDADMAMMLADISWDIAEHKQAAKALRESEERYRSLVEHSFDGIFIHDGSRIVFANSSLCEMLGYKEGELEGKEHWAVYDPAYQNITRQRAYARMQGKEVSPRYEVKLKKKDGSSFEGEITARAVSLQDLTGVQVWVRDISERKKSENALILAKEEWERTFDSISDFIFILDADHRILRANKSVALALGRSEEKITGKRCYEIVHGSDAPPWYCPHTKLLADGKEHHAEVIEPRIKALLEVRVSPLLDVQGVVVGSVHVARDISERKRAEESLRESEERYRSTMDAVGVGIYLIQDLRFRYVNPAMAHLHGYEPEEITDRLDCTDLIVPEQRQQVRENLIEMGHGESGMPYEIKCLRKDGSVFDAVVWGSEITYRGLPATVGTLIDITDHKRAENALQESEARHRELFKNASDFIYTHDLAGNYTSVNESGSKILGYSLKELMGFNFRSIIDPDYISVTEENLRKKVSEGYVVTGPYEVVVRTKHGKRLWLEVTSRIIKKDGNFVEVHGIARDITQRKKIEATLHQTQIKYQSVVESFDGLIYICSQDYEVEFANLRLVERTGFDPVGRKCYEAFHQREDMCPWCVSERVFCGETIQSESLSPKDNRWYHFVNSPISYEDGTVLKLTLAQDITERRKAEEEKEKLRDQLLQSQKMEAIGTLAGGIAHDFNNLLQVISGYSEVLRMNQRLDDKTLTGLNRIAQAARNGSALVKGLLTLSGRMESQRKPINMNQQVDEVVKLLSRTIPKVIQLESYLDEALPLINGDPVQLHQILMNLGINARDAMPDGGRLVFKTTRIILDGTHCRTHVEAEPGTYALLSVSDTGTGMDNETADHIFEPFFTTKPVGAGSGLGLSIVYGIVKQHGGYIKCESELGSGTTFEVYLPITEETGELPEEFSLAILPPGGNETLLLVDDDEVVRELAESMFVEMGYRVITATNGKEAVEKYKIEKESISLVILDLTMPEMNGYQCLREILKMDSSAKVLIASGHAENNLSKETMDRGAIGFVHKPYEVKQLLEKIREVLDRE